MNPVILAPIHRPRDAWSLLGNVVRQRASIPTLVIENGSAKGAYDGPGEVRYVEGVSTAGAARNACLEAARAAGFDAFIFFDADDFYDPTYVASRLGLLAQGYDAIGKTQGWCMLDDGLYRFGASGSILPSGGTYAGLVASALPFDDRLTVGEDHAWWRAMTAAGRRMHLDLDRAGYVYMRHDANTWQMPSALVRLGRGPAEYFGHELPSTPLGCVEVRDEPTSEEIFRVLHDASSYKTK